MADDIAYLCVYLLSVYIYDGKSVHIFCPFFNCLFCYYWDFTVLSLFGYKSFSRNVFCKYFLSVCDLPFHSLSSVFCRADVFNFNIVQLTNFFSCIGIVSKNSWQNPKLPRFFSYHFFWKLYHLLFYIWVYDPFWINFMKCIKSVYFLFACGHPVVPAQFVKNTILSQLNFLYSFDKDQLNTFVWIYLWAFYCVSLIYVSILSPILLLSWSL